MTREEFIGKYFGKWEVIKYLGKDANRNERYLCRCECGTEKAVYKNSLVRGRSRSCGCRSKEIYVGLSRTRLHTIWYNMKSRCYKEEHPKYKHYGGRGITICDEWKDDFLVFRKWALESGYADDLTIDRIDVNGNYCPENCRWVTQLVQQNNRRNNRGVKQNDERGF